MTVLDPWDIDDDDPWGSDPDDDDGDWVARFDPDPYLGLTYEQAAAEARARYDRFYPRRPGTPAAPASNGPACGITRMQITARTPDGQPVL